MFKLIKKLFSKDEEAQRLNDWNARNLVYSAISYRTLAMTRASSLEIVGKLICAVADGDEQEQKKLIAYLYRYCFAMLPPGGFVRLPLGMSSDISFIAQSVCDCPFEAIAHLHAFARSRGFRLIECLVDVLGDNKEAAPYIFPGFSPSRDGAKVDK